MIGNLYPKQAPWTKSDIQVSTLTRNTSNEKVKNDTFCAQSTHQFPNSKPSEDAYSRRCEILQRKDSKSHIRLSPFVIYERVADDRIRHMMRHQMTINIQYRNTSGHIDENKKDKMTSYFLDALASLGFKLEVTE